MKIRLTRIVHNKAVITMLSLAMFVLGVFLWGAKNNTVQAAVHMTSDVLPSTQEDYYFMTFTGDQVSTYLGKTAPTCDKSGYIFAGWFTQEVCETKESLRQNALYKNSAIDPAETYYAKFVAEDVLSVRVQVSNADANDSKDGDQRYMRLVSSVEAVGYATVGFQVKYQNENNEWKYKRNSSQLVYKRVESKPYSNNPAYSFSPKVMDTESEFFITSTWKGPDNNGIEDFDKYYCVRAFWNTFDGLTMAGTFRYVCVNDGLNTNIVNLTMKDAGETKNFTTGETVNVAYDDVDVEYRELIKRTPTSTATATVIYHDGTYAYLRIDLGNYNRATKLHTATWFDFVDKGVSILWRNLYSSHKNVRNMDRYIENSSTARTSHNGNFSLHHEDHTWYDTYLAYENSKNGDETEQNQNEFVIATSADLYGFLELSLRNRNKFYDKAGFADDGNAIHFENITVYFCNDITINEGEAKWTDASGNNEPTVAWVPNEGADTYYWYAIEGFAGILDGQDHVLSGLYAKCDYIQTGYTNNKIQDDKNAYYYSPGVGLLTVNTDASVIRNFNIINSYYLANYDGTGGVVAIGGGTVENVYTDIELDAVTVTKVNEINRGFLRNGGIYGTINGGQTGTIINCWSDANIVASNGYSGGIIGDTNGYAVTIQHALFSGNIYYAGDTYAHAGGLVGKASSESTDIALLTIQDSLTVGNINVDTKSARRSGSIIGSIGNAANVTHNNLSYENMYGIDNVTRIDKQKLDPIGWLAGTSKVPSQLTQPTNVCLDMESIKGNNLYEELMVGLEEDGYYWTLRENDTPMLTYFIGDSDKVISIDDLEKCPFVVTEVDGVYTGEICCLDRLISFRRKQNSGELDQYGSKLVVTMTADVAINEGNATDWAAGTDVPTQSWIAIKNFQGTFDGKGHTISGLYARQGTGQTGLGFFTTTKAATIQNLTVNNSFIEANTSNGTGGLVGCGSGTFKTIHTDVIIKDTEIASRLIAGSASCERIGGIIGKTTGDVVIEDCWTSGTIDSGYRYVGGMVGQAAAGTLTMKHCLNTGTLTHHYSTLTENTMPTGAICWGGLLGYSSSTVSVVIDDAFGYGAVSTLALAEAAEKGISLTGETTRVGMVAGAIAAVVNDNTSTYSVTNTFATDRAANTESGDYVATSTRTMIDNKTSLDQMITPTQTKNYLPFYYTTLDLRIYEDSTNYWVARYQNAPMLVSFLDEADTKQYLVNYYPTQYMQYNNKAYIFHAAQLIDLADNHPNVASTVKVRLMQDIVMNEGDASTWETSFSGTKLNAIQGFKGTFDGQGHTISGIYGTRKAGVTGVGLFTETVASTTIENLNITNSYFKTMDNNGTAAIAGNGAGTFKNIYVEAIIEDTTTAASGGASLIGTAARMGGIVGNATGNVTVDNCWSNCTITSAARHTLGGLVGAVGEWKATIQHSLFSGTITIGSTCGSNNAFTGGIIGTAGSATTQRAVLVSDCFSSGLVQSLSSKTIYSLGGLIGGAIPYETSTTDATTGVVTTTKTSYVTAANSYSVRNYEADYAGSTKVAGDALGYLYEDRNETTKIRVNITLDANNLSTVEAKQLSYYIGTAATTNATYLDYKNYWTVVTDSTPTLKYFVK